MINYSIIIPTHNRHKLMSKNIEYFSPFKNCQIYVCDSTEDRYKGEFPVNISYIHMPQKSFVEKMNLILEDIETDYVSVCADDDFIIENTLIEILEKMKSDDYVMGIGRYFGFDIPFNKFYPIYTNKKYLSIMNKNTNKRINSFMSNYLMSLWAVYNTQHLKEIYQLLNKIKPTNDNLIELSIALHMCKKGNIFISKAVYGLRECNNINLNSWKTQQSKLDYKILEENMKIFNKYDDSKLFEKGFWLFINSKEKSFLNRFKNKARKIINKLNFKSIYVNSQIEKLILHYYGKI